MTVQNALLFLAAARQDGVIRSCLAAQQDNPGVLCSLAREHGLDFGADELQQAFRHDWALRALRESRTSAVVSELPVPTVRCGQARPEPSRS
ncbi:Nif11-like leader peptide family natural product precursor [Rhizorhabdus sp.]|uniref:Nif11-like leader peptide family natural product precursor n=1 Tax=Rhizorhabdus sp. TaxID=1968843 RepID=UPI0035AF9668